MTTTRAERALKVLTIVMGVVIVVGFGVVGAVIIGRVARSGDTGKPFAAAPIAIPAGARIEKMTAAGDRLALALALAGGGQEIVIVDLASGRLLGRVALRPAP